MGGIQKLLKFFDMEDDSDDDDSSEYDEYDDYEYDDVMSENTALYICLVLMEMWYGAQFD